MEETSELQTVIKVLNPIALCFMCIFFIVVGPNNWTTHTYFHGPGTGELLTARGDFFWFVEFFFVIALFSATCINLLPAYGQLKSWNFPWWLWGTILCLLVMGLWQTTMIRELILANSCSRPFNRANDLLWCSACHNTTVSDETGLKGDFYCRYRPVPADEITTGKLSVRADFYWAWITGGIATMLHFVIFIIASIDWSISNVGQTPVVLETITTAIKRRMPASMTEKRKRE